MLKSTSVPLSRAEALEKLNRYISISPIEIKKTVYGTTCYLYEDGTKIELFLDELCEIWDSKTKRWGYTSDKVAIQFAAKLNRIQI